MKNNEYTTCPKCGSDIPEDAPGGLCPTCVLGGAVTTPANTRISTAGGRKAPPPTVDEIAPHFPELEILELLGAGGMGAVYQARQPQLDRMVAVKILSAELAEDPTFVERFNREARVLARMSHPNIVGIFDFGTAGPYCYLLMEYVDGVNLRQAMRTGGFAPAEALALVQEICSALEFAHEEGILHRDIKPENVLITSKGQIKIADFGIAKLLGEGEQEDITLTMQGSILGSPHYMAPEQIETPDDVDQRADIYSLGVVLYEMLTGELPIGRFAAPSEKVAAIDARIDDIVFRTLEKERQARYQSAGQVMTEVQAVTQNPGASSVPPPLSPVNSGPLADAGSARFSLTSAILTGFSVIATVVIFVLWTSQPSVAEPANQPPGTLQWGFVFAIFCFAAAAGAALTGFFLGAKAVGDVRKSGGQKSGLGFAMFAVVTWPLLILMAASTFFLSGGGSMGTQIVMLCIVLCFIPGAILIVRGIWRWARGVVSDEDGKRRHPGYWMSLFLGAGLIVLGPVLIQMILLALLHAPVDESFELKDAPSSS